MSKILSKSEMSLEMEFVSLNQANVTFNKAANVNGEYPGRKDYGKFGVQAM